MSSLSQKLLNPAVLALALAAPAHAQWTDTFNGGSASSVNAMATFGGNLAVAGPGPFGGGTTPQSLGVFDGTTWQFPVSFPSTVQALAGNATGTLAVGTNSAFAVAGGASTEINPGYFPLFGFGGTRAVAVLPDGRVVAGGGMYSFISGPASAGYRLPVQIFDPTVAAGINTIPITNVVNSAPFTNPLNGVVVAMAVTSPTTIVIGGSQIPVGVPGAFVNTNLAILTVTATNATAATIPGAPTGTVTALRSLLNGDLAVVIDGALFVASGTPAVFTPVATPAIGEQIADVIELPDGDLVVAGGFTSINGTAAPQIARLRGGVVIPMAPAGALRNTSPGSINQLEILNSRLIAAGSFDSLDGVAAGNLASLQLPRIRGSGVGCVGPFGTTTLTAQLPWTGDTLTATATGTDPGGITLLVRSTARNTGPNPAALLPGCVLGVRPDLLTVMLPNGSGGFTTPIAVPNDPTLVGQTLFIQALGFDIGLTTATASGTLGLIFAEV